MDTASISLMASQVFKLDKFVKMFPHSEAVVYTTNVNSSDCDQTAPKEQSDHSLHCLLEQVCLIICVKYGSYISGILIL